MQSLPSLMQGIAALMAMNSLEIEADLEKMGWGSAQHLHATIESMRLGFVDTLQYNADPQVHPVCLEAYSWSFSEHVWQSAMSSRGAAATGKSFHKAVHV